MEEFYLDLSDNIFIHKDFVEVVNLKLPKGTTLLELFEQYTFDKKGEVVVFKISIWKGVKLESIFISPEDLKVLVESKANVVGLEYYWCTIFVQKPIKSCTIIVHRQNRWSKIKPNVPYTLWKESFSFKDLITKFERSSYGKKFKRINIR